MQAQPFFPAQTEEGLMTPWTAFLSSSAAAYPFPAMPQSASIEHQWASWSAPVANDYPMYMSTDDMLPSYGMQVKAEPGQQDTNAGSISPSLLFTASPATFLPMPSLPPSASASVASYSLNPLSRSWSNETPHLSSPSPSASEASALPLSPPSLPVSEPEHESDHEQDENEGIERDGKIWGMPTEQYRALSARERKRVRNRISARTFRAKRKEHLNSLEHTLANKDAQIKAANDEAAKLRREVTELRRRLSKFEKDKPYDRPVGRASR